MIFYKLNWQSMTPDNLFQKIKKLTLALYRVTGYFPQDEVLRRQIRQIGNELLLSFDIAEDDFNADGFDKPAGLLTSFVLTKKGKDDIIDKANKLRALFLIARQQNWVNFRNFDFLDNYCQEIVREVIIQKNFELLEKQKIQQENPEQSKFSLGNAATRILPKKEEEIKYENLSDRQKEILDIVSKKEKTRFSDIQSVFKNTPPRTIRRDIQILYLNGLVKRNGRHPDFFYTS